MPGETSSRRFALFVALFGFSIAAEGCCGCCGKAVPALQTVPAGEPEKAAPSYLEKASSIASTMCGVPSKGLKVTKVTAEPSFLPGAASIHVEGTPILAPDAGSIDPKKLALCSGAVYLSMELEKKPDGSEKWTIESAKLTSVTTPGVVWSDSSSIDWD